MFGCVCHYTLYLTYATLDRGSLVSACLSAAGYLSFSAILAKSTPETPLLYIWLTAAYFLVGAATVGSYFACLTCGMSRYSFPPHIKLNHTSPKSIPLLPDPPYTIPLAPTLAHRSLLSRPLLLFVSPYLHFPFHRRPRPGQVLILPRTFISRYQPLWRPLYAYHPAYNSSTT